MSAKKNKNVGEQFNDYEATPEMCIRDSLRYDLPYGSGGSDDDRLSNGSFCICSDQVLSLIHIQMCIRDRVCTPHMAGLTTDVDNWSGEMMAQEVLAYLEGNERKYIWKR